MNGDYNKKISVRGLSARVVSPLPILINNNYYY